VVPRTLTSSFDEVSVFLRKKVSDMNNEMPKTYDPSIVEQAWYEK